MSYNQFFQKVIKKFQLENVYLLVTITKWVMSNAVCFSVAVERFGSEELCLP